MPTATYKTCSKCGEHKSLEEFPKHIGRPDGRASQCKRCHCADQLERYYAKKAGTWKPKRPRVLPTAVPAPLDVGWVAGFLEGEAHFGCTNGNSMRVTAMQKEREPLDRLARFYGGRVHDKTPPSYGGRTYWSWSVHGYQAAALIDDIYPYLSKRRQAQIGKARKEVLHV